MRIVFEPRDMWIGLYWNRTEGPLYGWTDYYLCLLPCIVIQWRSKPPMPGTAAWYQYRRRHEGLWRGDE